MSFAQSEFFYHLTLRFQIFRRQRAAIALGGYACLNSNSVILGQIRQVASATFVLRAASAVLALGASSLIAHWLGPKEFGVYSYVLALTGLATVIVGLGFPTLVLRQTATSKVTSEWGLVKGLLLHSSALVFLVSTGVGAVVWTVGLRLGHYSHIPGFRVDLFLAIVTMAFTAETSLLASASQGLNKIIASTIPSALVIPGAFLIGVIVLHAWNGLLSVPSILFSQAVMTLGLVGILTVQLVRWLPREFFHSAREVRFPAWLANAFPFLMNSMMITINMRTDVFLLGVLKGPEVAGVYNAATRGAMLLVMPLGALITASQPTIASLFAQGQTRRLQEVITMTSRLACLVSMIGGIILILCGKALLGVLFGPAFTYGASALVILSIARIVNAGTGSLGPFLSMTNRPKALGIGLASQALLNVGFNFVLIPAMGMNGSALATGGSMALSNIVLTIWTYKHSGYDVSFLGLHGGSHNKAEEASIKNA